MDVDEVDVASRASCSLEDFSVAEVAEAMEDSEAEAEDAKHSRQEDRTCSATSAATGDIMPVNVLREATRTSQLGEEHTSVGASAAEDAGELVVQPG